MTNEPDRLEHELETRTKALFDACVDGIDAATRAKLTRARRQAIAAIDGSADRAWQGRRVPQAAAAGILVAAAVTWLIIGADRASQPQFEMMAGVADLELLLDDEELEMFEELEFYAWLEQQPELQPIDDRDDGAG